MPDFHDHKRDPYKWFVCDGCGNSVLLMPFSFRIKTRLTELNKIPQRLYKCPECDFLVLSYKESTMIDKEGNWIRKSIPILLHD